MKNIVIPDANVFVKLLNPEADSKVALQFFIDCAECRSKLIVPELFVYEVLEITRKYHENFSKTLKLISDYKSTLLDIVSPDERCWLKAEEITAQGHPKSGYPSVYDSIYHALAIESNGIFVTADKKHFEKSKHFGHIIMLSDWQSNIIKTK